ncbi:MAG: hypothetical protein Q8O09_04990 [Bacillota bacterium]|nr:hypothetical protein [Bacillota bacterium]
MMELVIIVGLIDVYEGWQFIKQRRFAWLAVLLAFSAMTLFLGYLASAQDFKGLASYLLDAMNIHK